MAKQRIHNNLGEFESLTQEELNSSLWQHEQKVTQARLAGIKLMKLPIVSVQALIAGNLTLAVPGQACGPDSGFLWSLRRVLITSSGGYTSPTSIAGPALLNATGTAVDAAPGTSLATFNLPATNSTLTWNIAWTAALSTAPATVPNNFALAITGQTTTPSINPVAIGSYPQQVIVYTQPPGGAKVVAVKTLAIDAGVSYTGQVSASLVSALNLVGAGDSADVNYLYAGSDTSANQNTALEGSAISLGRSWFPSSTGAWVMTGEQIYATLSNVTAGNTYTLTGVAIEVPTEMIGKIAK